MAPEASTKRMFRVSLREMLILFAALALGCAALRYANVWWQCAVIALAFAVAIAAAITALVDRGKRQAFAVGFLAGCLGYAALVQNCRTIVPAHSGSSTTRNDEIERPRDGLLPTTRMLYPLYQAVVRTMWKNVKTDEVVAEQDLPENAQKVRLVGPFNATGRARYIPFSHQGRIPMNVKIPAGQLGSSYTRLGDRPIRDHFMLIGHILWAMLFGYVSGKFAQFVYGRRIKRSPMSPEVDK